MPTGRGSRRRIAGVDEAGRGPLAGPVVAAAVIFDPGRVPEGIRDSKRLSEAQRERLFAIIQEQALSWAIAEASVAEVDRLNILQASLLAMSRAVAALDPGPDHVHVDGNRCPRWHWSSEAIVGGDALIAEISAASILAKVSRDRDMRELDKRFPGYGFAAHKGYPTTAHLEALERLGPSPVHRLSFAPVRKLKEAAQSVLPGM